MSEAAPSRQEQFSGTKEVTEQHRIDEVRLAQWLDGHVEGYEGPLSVRQFKGGQSNPTYQLVTPKRNYVLRRKPPGKLLPSAHAVDREFRVISALYPTGFPVPRPYALCADESVIGTMFYVMDCVEGRVLWEPLLPGMEPAERRAIWDTQNETLARLHNLDYQKIGLGDFGRPGNYFARQISRWGKQYLASVTAQIDEMDRLLEWLPANIPPGERACVVHGDYRLDNMILHPSEPKCIAVLDWEISTIGDPLADFTYHLAQWRMPDRGGAGTATLANADLPSLGIPTEDEYVAAYCRRTGRDGIEQLDYYFAYNFFRLACILQGIVGRVRDGTAASAHAAANEAAVRPLAERAWHFAQKAGAV
ncbi:MAG: phosphotransferase family protein [Alphaproteobacteria bacterium]|nr:phosphotransferase family protein [Alphaproteobacteria bacterium]